MFYFVFQGAKKTRGSLKNTENKKKNVDLLSRSEKIKTFFRKTRNEILPFH